MARPTTEHYGLTLYGPQGTGDPLGVYSAYNPSMVIIDSILFQLKGLIDALEARMDDAEGRLDGIDQSIAQINRHLEQLDQTTTNISQQLGDTTTAVWAAIEAILAHTQGGGTVDHDTGAISWGASGSYAIGNINLTSGSGYIRTHAATDQDNDVKVV